MAEKLRVHLIDKEKLTVCGAHKYSKSVILESISQLANCGNCLRKKSLFKVKIKK